MGGFIALYVTACLNFASPGSCVTELVTDSTQNQMTMTGCLGVDGLSSAKEFVEKHPLYHTWRFKGWSCQIGNSRPRRRGRHESSVTRLDQSSELTVGARCKEDSDDSRLREFI